MKTVYVLGGMLAGAAWLGAQPVAAAIFNGTLGLKADPAQVTASRHKAVKVASPAIKPTTVVQGLNRPWSLAFLPQGGYLVTERGGQLNYAPDFATKPVRVGGMPKDIEVSGQSGLFEIALAPDFETSREVFVSYGAETAKGNVMKVVRAVLDVRAAKPALQDVKVVFTSVDPVKDDKNLGGKLMFMADGTLLVTVGDFFEQDESQNLGNHLGKVIRINRDGSVPTNNPMVGRAGVRPEIYSYGNRNVQGIAVRPGT
ncbi:MAG: PQQ-dependent sugar dehydrogenase, partial [Alphaproteobacteria bacterium]